VPGDRRRAESGGESTPEDWSVDPGESREWTAPELQEALAEVVAHAVGERFVTMPLVVPSEAFFPEPFEPTLGWYERVTSRFMGLCGLGGDELQVDLLDAGALGRLEGPPRVGRLEGHTEAHRTVTWFAGLEVPTTGRPRCHFGLDLRQLREPETLSEEGANEVTRTARQVYDLRAAALS